jgi:hypothetical protein
MDFNKINQIPWNKRWTFNVKRDAANITICSNFVQTVMSNTVPR